MSKIFTTAEVQADKNLIVVGDEVFDIGAFARLHPGGEALLRAQGGKDVTNEFAVFHGPHVLAKYRERLLVGKVQRGAAQQTTTTFGSGLPYADPAWYGRLASPYYGPSHVAWRARVRAFVETEVLPTMDEWSESPKGAPRELQLKMGKEGFLAAMTGHKSAGAYLDPDAKPLPDDFDPFHELILFDEFCRCGNGAVISALTNGPAIALSAVLSYGSKEMKERVCREVLSGRKNIALAITEPQAGSDVSGLVTSAKRQGDNYVLSGGKKYITNGMYSDYYVVAVRTGGPGHGGLSFVLVERDVPNFNVRKVAVRGATVSGTAYLDFADAPVPVRNRIGAEGAGFSLVTHNFNHERWYISVCACRLARVCIEEAEKYAVRRVAFGQPLAAMQSVRMRLANMALEVEQYQAWIESITYQMKVLPDANTKLGQVIALLKAQGSRVYEKCAASTTHILGGNALWVAVFFFVTFSFLMNHVMQMDGPGRKIEIAVNQVKSYQIPAGAEETMIDFVGRSMIKQMAKL